MEECSFESEENEILSDSSLECSFSASSLHSVVQSQEDQSSIGLIISFIDLLEALMEDISELRKENMTFKGSFLDKIEDIVVSMQMELLSDIGSNSTAFFRRILEDFAHAHSEMRKDEEEMWAMSEKEKLYINYEDFESNENLALVKENGDLEDSLGEPKDISIDLEDFELKEDLVFGKEHGDVEESLGEPKGSKDISIVYEDFELKDDLALSKEHGDVEDSLDEPKDNKDIPIRSDSIVEDNKLEVKNATDSLNDGDYNGEREEKMAKSTEEVNMVNEMGEGRNGVTIETDVQENFKKLGSFSKTSNESCLDINRLEEENDEKSKYGQIENTEISRLEGKETFIEDEKQENMVSDMEYEQEMPDSEFSFVPNDYLNERWSYSEIDDSEGKCKTDEISEVKKEEVFNYPLTRQQKMERSYEIRKEKAWQKWLDERDKDKRRKALLEIKRFMYPMKRDMKNKMVSRTLTKDGKSAWISHRDIQMRQNKEIEKRIAIERALWKKKMEEWKMRLSEEAAAAASRRHHKFLNPPLPQTMFFASKKKTEAVITYRSNPMEIKSVRELPTMLKTDEETETSTQKKKVHKERGKRELKDHLHGSGDKLLEKEAENFETVDEEKGPVKYKGECYEEWLLLRLQQAIKLFNHLRFPCQPLQDDKLCTHGWSKKIKAQPLEDITIGNFQITPEVVIFKDFIPKMSYHQKITIRNLDMQTRQICIVGLWYSDESLINQGILEFDKSTGNIPRTVHIRPGLTFDFWLFFKPRSIADSTAVSAQVALMVGQGPLLAGRDDWAKEKRAQCPDIVKDAGYKFISVYCREARPEPTVVNRFIRLNVNAYAYNKQYPNHKEITVVNKGALGCSYRLLKLRKDVKHKLIMTSSSSMDEILDSSEQIDETQSAMTVRSSRLRASSQKRKSTVHGLFASKVPTFITDQRNSKMKSTVSYGPIVARRIMEDIFDIVTSCFSCIPQYFGDLHSNSSTKITVKVKKGILSNNKNKVIEKYILYFSDNSLIPEVYIWLIHQPHDTEEKVSVNKLSLDFGICTAGGIYQDQLEVNNGFRCSKGIILSLVSFSETSMNPKNPIYPHSLEILPKGLIFVQGYSSFSFTVRLVVGKADRNINDYSENVCSNQGLSCDLEMFIINPEPLKGEVTVSLAKNLMCRIHVSALLSDIASNIDCLPLVLEPSDLVLGRCLTTETIQANIHLSSNSKITLTYGFLGLPKYVTLQPGYGFGKILPGEQLTLVLLYSPLPEHGCLPPGKAFQFRLKCYNVLNKASPSFTIPAEMTVEATVVHIPNLHLSCSTLCFPATPCSSYSTASITLTSTLDEKSDDKIDNYKIQNQLSMENIGSIQGNRQEDYLGYWYEFLPQSEDIIISPSRGYINYGQTVKFQLFFKPKFGKNELESKAKEMMEDYNKILYEKELEIRRKEDEEKEKTKQGKKKKGKEEKKGKKKESSKSNKSKSSASQKKSSEHSEETPTGKDKSKKNSPRSAKSSSKKGKNKQQPQKTLAENGDLNDNISKLLFPAEQRLLEMLEPYMCYSKIACLVAKGYPSDAGTGIGKFSKKSYLANINKSSTLRDYIKYPLHTISAGSTWVTPKDEITPEILWLEVLCPVVRPGFLIRDCGSEWMQRKQNLKLEFESYLNEKAVEIEKLLCCDMKAPCSRILNFGSIAVNGGSRTLTITLQNISAASPLTIGPTSLLNPVGPFTSPQHLNHNFKGKNLVDRKDLKVKGILSANRGYSMAHNSLVLVPPEHIIRIPVTFAPDSEGQVREFMDIQGKSAEGIVTQTTIPLIGMGELPKFKFQPSPPIVTLKQIKGKISKPSTVKVHNLCNASLDFYVGKIFQIIEPEKKKKGKEKKKPKTKDSANEELDNKKSKKNAKKKKEENDEEMPKKNADKKKKMEKTIEEGKKVEEKKKGKTKDKKMENPPITTDDEKINKEGENEIKNTDEGNEKKDTTLELEQTMFTIDPPDILRVNALSVGEMRFLLHPNVEKMQKSFAVPLTIFGKGASIVNITIKVVSK